MKAQPFLRRHAGVTRRRIVPVDLAEIFQHVPARHGKVLRHFYNLSPSMGEAMRHQSLARLCQEKLAEDPFSGCVFVFRSRSGTAIRLLTYDGQGYWLAQKRLSIRLPDRTAAARAGTGRQSGGVDAVELPRVVGARRSMMSLLAEKDPLRPWLVTS